MAKRARGLGAAIAATFCLGAHAETVACYITYGGETRTILAQPTTTPYGIVPTTVGSFFLFRIVFRREPADLAGIKLYVYGDRDSGPAIVHQASHAYPPLNAGTHGFTGQNFVYEPMRDSELQYHCELKSEAVK